MHPLQIDAQGIDFTPTLGAASGTPTSTLVEFEFEILKANLYWFAIRFTHADVSATPANLTFTLPFASNMSAEVHLLASAQIDSSTWEFDCITGLAAGSKTAKVFRNGLTAWSATSGNPHVILSSGIVRTNFT